MGTIENYLPSILRNLGFFSSVLWTFQFTVKAMREEVGCVRTRLTSRVKKNGHDLILMMLVPMFGYTIFSSNIQLSATLEQNVTYPILLLYMLLKLWIESTRPTNYKDNK